jgi:hypothetical protein
VTWETLGSLGSLGSFGRLGSEISGSMSPLQKGKDAVKSSVKWKMMGDRKSDLL